MALIHIDSCDHYDSATSVIKWASAVTVQAGGRTGNNCIQSGTKVFDLRTTITMGMAVKHAVLGDSIIYMKNPASGLIVYVGLVSDSRIYLQFQPRGPVGSAVTHYSDITVCRANWWFYFEIQLTHTSVDNGDTATDTLVYNVRINEESVLSGTEARVLGWPYDSAVQSGFTQCEYRWGGNAAYYDDIYFTDDEFLGDGHVYVIRPNAEGDYAAWDTKSGGDQYVEVKDIIPDGDTSYIERETVDAISMVNLEDLVILGDILGVQVNTIGEKTDTGGAAFKQYNKISNTYVEGTETIYPSYINWLDQMCTYRVNPVTSANFTLAEVNAMQAGIKRTI